MKSEKKCCICDGKFGGLFDGKPYCNKHWLRLYTHGTTELAPRKSTNLFDICGDELHIQTTSGAIIKADSADYNILSKYSWCISKTGYAVARIDGRVMKMQRFLLGDEATGMVVDHINGDKLDNRRRNLRPCKQVENSRNTGKGKNNTTGYTGVSKSASGKYRARIMVDRKEIRLGTFDRIEDAVKARQEAETLYFGEFAPCKRGCI